MLSCKSFLPYVYAALLSCLYSQPVSGVGLMVLAVHDSPQQLPNEEGSKPGRSGRR